MEDPMSVTPDQLFLEELPKLFQADKAGNTNATIQFDLSGDEGGQYNVRIADGQATPSRGAADSPDLTLRAEANDAVRIFTGQMDPTAAFMTGKLKIQGNMGLALKLQSLFKRPS
jgi:putative sterol carrier protein